MEQRALFSLRPGLGHGKNPDGNIFNHVPTDGNYFRLFGRKSQYGFTLGFPMKSMKLCFNTF